MTEKKLHEYFPELSVMDFKVLCNIAYHGEIPSSFSATACANEEMVDSSDILCISDFGWCELEDDVKELISQAKSGGMKFYGLAVADHLWMGFGPEEAMNTMDSKWQWHVGECISLNEDKKKE